MATQQEVRQQVGEELGLVPVGQALESQDQARIDKAYEEQYARLKAKGLAGWALSGEVPDRLVPYFALMIEQKLLIAFSVPESRYLRISTDAGPDGTMALVKLAELTIQEHESTDDAVDY